MKRREFVGLFGGLAAAWPLAAGGQQGQARTVGWLGGGTAIGQSPWAYAFSQRLGVLGWNEGRNLTLEFRWADGRSERLAEIADEFVRLKVDAILAAGTDAALAAKRATNTISIVFPVGGDPVGVGLVASLARPGANVTGISDQGADLAAKRLELLNEVVAGIKQVAVLANPGYSASMLEFDEVQSAGSKLGIEILQLKVPRGEDVEAILASIRGRAQALYVIGDPLLHANRVRLNGFARPANLPTIFPQREYLDAGGFISYGPNFPDLSRRAADMVDKILRGAKPADLPVEQPTKFDLVVNLDTAKVLGIEVPPALLARADEVIE
jgi:putative ABC transport system substrate-binding protein